MAFGFASDPTWQLVSSHRTSSRRVPTFSARTARDGPKPPDAGTDAEVAEGVWETSQTSSVSSNELAELARTSTVSTCANRE